MIRPNARQLARIVIVVAASLAAGTALVAAIDASFGLPTGSAVYLVAVVASAYLGGTLAAILAAIGAPLLYNFFFIEPRYTLAIADPRFVLDVALLLFIGIVVGQLVAVQRVRADVARSREREARALFRISRTLATRGSTAESLIDIVEILQLEAGMARVWVALGEDDSAERVVADTNVATPPLPGMIHVLQRTPGDLPARWARIHHPHSRSGPGSGSETYRVRIEAGGVVLGSIWGQRPRGQGLPDRTETRLLSAAADQVGQVITQDRLAAGVAAAEIARRHQALQSALLQSVSHDVRTPLAAIRAAAGGLEPDSGLDRTAREASVGVIERNVENLDRLVTNLLDLSRMEAGELRVDREAVELDDIVSRVLQRLQPRIASHPLKTRLDGPPVAADPILLDAAVTNILDNAIQHTPPTAAITVQVSEVGEDRVRLSVEDGGPGVDAEELPNLFDRFYRARHTERTGRRGTGIGLAVVRGFAEAMGGQVRARRSSLGGLAIELDLPAADIPPASMGLP